MIVRVADAAGRRNEPFDFQGVCVSDRGVLRSGIAMVQKPLAHRPIRVFSAPECHFQALLHELGVLDRGGFSADVGVTGVRVEDQGPDEVDHRARWQEPDAALGGSGGLKGRVQKVWADVFGQGAEVGGSGLTGALGP